MTAWSLRDFVHWERRRRRGKHVLGPVELAVEEGIVWAGNVTPRQIVKREEEIVHHTVPRCAGPAQTVRMAIVVLETRVSAQWLLALILPLGASAVIRRCGRRR
jgi:hypothetical protein